MNLSSISVGAILLGFFVHSLSSFASEPDRALAACAALQDSIERLACYDDLAGTRDVASPKIDTVKKGVWQVTTETSKIDDSTNVILALLSESSFTDRYSKEKWASLYIVCREKSTDLFIVMGGMFLADSGGFGQVTYRIDKSKAKEVEFSASTDHQALGLWNGTGVRLIKEMMAGQRLLLRITPFNESPETVEFKISGLSEAVKPLRKACEW